MNNGKVVEFLPLWVGGSFPKRGKWVFLLWASWKNQTAVRNFWRRTLRLEKGKPPPQAAHCPQVIISERSAVWYESPVHQAYRWWCDLLFNPLGSSAGYLSAQLESAQLKWCDEHYNGSRYVKPSPNSILQQFPFFVERWKVIFSPKSTAF